MYDTENPPKFFRALDILIKGPDFPLPREAYYPDAHGHLRRRARLYWWTDREQTPEHKSFQNSQTVMPSLSSKGLSDIIKLRNKFKYAVEIPVIIGHYNLDVGPNLTSPNIGCVNFKGHVVAYRWNKGDKAIHADRLVYV